VMGLALDYRLNFVELVALGTFNCTIVEPREVFHMAVHKNSKYVILAHNHPGGTLEPSEEDEDFTDRLIHAAELLYLKVIDHLIISKHGFYSFKIMGLLDELEQSKKYAVYFIEEEKLLAEGKAEGVEEGIEIGEEKGKIEIAKVMKTDGEPIDKIVKYTRLPSECRRARDAKRDIPVPLSPCARATTCTCRGRPAPGPRLRHFAPPPDPYDEWLDGVSDALASGLRQLRDLRPLRHFGQPLAPTPTADYPPRASRFPGGQR